MKTFQEFYNEILANDELKAAFAEAAKSGKTEEFLKAQGCEVTAEELAEFLKSQTGELSDEELDNASGGCSTEEVVGSVTTLGLACAANAITSAIDGSAC